MRPREVSIPAGFSDALRLNSLGVDRKLRSIRVSIPAGFSDALRPRSSFVQSHQITFQSLLGFLMRCDDAVRIGAEGADWVSIPAGFSDAL